MVIPFADNAPRLEHISKPIRLASLIQETISMLDGTTLSENLPEDPDTENGHSIITINEKNRSEIERLIKSKTLVVAHCRYTTDEETRITLSTSTYLWDESHDYRSKLIYADGVAISPDIQVLSWMDTARFTLYFEPLPPNCRRFWFWEQTYEPYAFAAFDIKRNRRDEYSIKLVSAPF